MGQPTTDIASAVTAAGGKPISLHHFPHIGIVGDGQAEEVGFLHVIGRFSSSSMFSNQCRRME